MKLSVLPLMISGLIGQTANAGQWQAGIAVEASRPILQEKKSEASVTPMLNYIGDKFSMVGGTLAYQIMGSDTLELSLIAQGRDGGFSSSDSDALSGMAKREAGLDAELQLTQAGLGGVTQISLLSDITNTSGGSEIDLRYAYPLQQGRWTFEPAIGVSWKNTSLVDYYYGVRQDEANTERRAYKGKAALNIRTEFVLAYKVSRKWSVVGGVGAERLDRSIRDSPVTDQDYAITAYSAVLYNF